MENEIADNPSETTVSTSESPHSRGLLRTYIEYSIAWVVYHGVSLLPRSFALFAGRILAAVAYRGLSRLRRNASNNLKLAYPQLSDAERQRIEKGVFQSLGRMLGETSQFDRINRGNIEKVVVYDGLENYHRAVEKGKGVILLTGHIGAWELSVFAHSVYGYPMSFLARKVDNPLVEKMVLKARTRYGNRCIDKKGSMREVLRTLKSGGVVGILSDLNTTREEGVFVDFFGIPACTTAGVATLALRTGAAVLPGYIVWDEAGQIHRLCFAPEIETINTGNQKEDVVANTAAYARFLEGVIRSYPDQWLWIHRRWRTRPEGESEVY